MAFLYAAVGYVLIRTYKNKLDALIILGCYVFAAIDTYEVFTR